MTFPLSPTVLEWLRRPVRVRGSDRAGRSGQSGTATAGNRWRIRGRAVHGISQLILGLSIWGLYLLMLALPTARTAADAHGAMLLRIETYLHLDVERSLQRIVEKHQVLGAITAWEYATTYILTTFLVLAWAWWHGGQIYRWLRNVLALTTVLAIGCFALWPVTPPRLLPSAGFVDIVVRHHPPLSWGSEQVSAGADQFAAMPSLHTAWAIWVALATWRLRRRFSSLLVGIGHVSLTVFVVLVTGNHYVLDAVGAAVVIGLAISVEGIRMRWFTRRTTRPVNNALEVDSMRMAAPDEFFLHVEKPTVPQPVGGFVVLDSSDRALDVEDLRELIARRAPDMPRFHQRLAPASWFVHTRWVPAGIDVATQVREHRLPERDGEPAGYGGINGLSAFVAELAEQELDRSRPMWQLWLVPNVSPGRSAVVAIMHHCFADGLGVVDILRALLEPELPPPDLSGIRIPAWPIRLLAGCTGLVGLARDGRAEQLPFTQPLSAKRLISVAQTDLEAVRELARRNRARVSDVLLAAIGQAVSDLMVLRGEPVANRLFRAAVPVTTRPPAPDGTGRTAQAGNLTAALRLDVPLDVMSFVDRLRLTADAADPRRRSGRAIATTFVMRVLGWLPPGLQGAAARAMYRGRFFNAIVSNMPGPSESMRMIGAPILQAYPIIPLAERVPLGVGVLGWNGQFCLSVITDAHRLPEGEDLAERIVAVIEEATGVTEMLEEPVAGSWTA